MVNNNTLNDFCSFLSSEKDTHYLFLDDNLCRIVQNFHGVFFSNHFNSSKLLVVMSDIKECGDGHLTLALYYCFLLVSQNLFYSHLTALRCVGIHRTFISYSISFS